MHDNLPAYAKGVLGEAAVCDRLTDGGMELLERRFRSPFGEIDLVMMDAGTLVFIEVKARATGRAGAGLVSVGARKRARIVKTALYYLTEHPCDCPCRFDALEVTRDGWQHIVGAFEGSEFS